MSLYDVLYNWLQLKLVLDARPFDEAAKESLEHVTDILREHHVEILEVIKDPGFYQVNYLIDGEQKSEKFWTRLAEVLLDFIKQDPERYEFK